jgi:hypothetical protein
MTPLAPKLRGMIVAAILAVVIGSGLAGAAIERFYIQRSTRIVGDTSFHPISSSLRSPTVEERKQMRSELSAALTLTAEQNRIIDSILASRAGQFDALRESIRPQVQGLLTAVRADIETVLTPGQKARYRQLNGTR